MCICFFNPKMVLVVFVKPPRNQCVYCLSTRSICVFIHQQQTCKELPSKLHAVVWVWRHLFSCASFDSVSDWLPGLRMWHNRTPMKNDVEEKQAEADVVCSACGLLECFDWCKSCRKVSKCWKCSESCVLHTQFFSQVQSHRTELHTRHTQSTHKQTHTQASTRKQRKKSSSHGVTTMAANGGRGQGVLVTESAVRAGWQRRSSNSYIVFTVCCHCILMDCVDVNQSISCRSNNTFSFHWDGKQWQWTADSDKQWQQTGQDGNRGRAILTLYLRYVVIASWWIVLFVIDEIHVGLTSRLLFLTEMAELQPRRQTR